MATKTWRRDNKGRLQSVTDLTRSITFHDERHLEHTWTPLIHNITNDDAIWYCENCYRWCPEGLTVGMIDRYRQGDYGQLNWGVKWLYCADCRAITTAANASWMAINKPRNI